MIASRRTERVKFSAGKQFGYLLMIPDQLAHLLEEGKSMSHIAQILGVVPSQVTRQLVKDHSDNRHIRLLKIRCLQLSLENIGIEVISQITGINENVVNKWISHYEKKLIGDLPRIDFQNHRLTGKVTGRIFTSKHHFKSRFGFNKKCYVTEFVGTNILDNTESIKGDGTSMHRVYKRIRISQLYLNGVGELDICNLCRVYRYIQYKEIFE